MTNATRIMRHMKFAANADAHTEFCYRIIRAVMVKLRDEA